MIRAVIFDFDGTLSSEREYIYGCFKYIEPFIQQKFGIIAPYEKLVKLFNESWTDTFGRLLNQENVKHTKQDITELVTLYRQAPPVVLLYEDSERALQELKNKGLKTAILTNGYCDIQKEKIQKSGLEKWLDAVEIPDLYGRDFWKPDRRRIEELLRVLGLKPEQTLYVGDSDNDYKMACAAGLPMAFIKRKDCVNDFHFEKEAAYILESLLELGDIVDR